MFAWRKCLIGHSKVAKTPKLKNLNTFHFFLVPRPSFYLLERFIEASRLKVLEKRLSVPENQRSLKSYPCENFPPKHVEIESDRLGELWYTMVWVVWGVYCRLSRFLLAQRAAGLSLWAFVVGGDTHTEVYLEYKFQYKLHSERQKSQYSIMALYKCLKCMNVLVMENEEEDNCNQSWKNPHNFVIILCWEKWFSPVHY